MLPTTTHGFVQVIKRNSTGGFTVHPPVFTVGIPTSIVVADLDGDGHSDVAASCSGITGSYPVGSRPTAVVMRGTGSSANDAQSTLLGVPSPIDVGNAYAQGTGVALTDADHDGIPDLAVSWYLDYGQGVISGGGAAVFPTRDRRSSGGLTLGSQLTFAGEYVPTLAPLGASSLLSIRQPTYLGSPSMQTTDFAAQVVQGDLDGDGVVGTADLALLLLDFGPCYPQAPCPSDLDGDGQVGTGDISFLLLLFG